MKTLIENYINGNLTTAKKQAKRHSWGAIYKFLHDECFWSERESRAVADYLKGKGKGHLSGGLRC